MALPVGDGSLETEREIFLDAAVEYLRERDIRRPITDAELKRISSELGYQKFDHALALFSSGITRDPYQNMRFGVQICFADAAPKSAANQLHPLHLWTPDQILEQTVRICRIEKIVGPLTHSQVHILFTMGSLPSASTIDHKFDQGTGWGFYKYQTQSRERLQLAGLPVRDVVIPRGLAETRDRRQAALKPKTWNRKSAVQATVAYLTKLDTFVLPSNTEIDIAARRGEMPSTKVLDTLFAKNSNNDGTMHFRAYIDQVVGPELARSNQIGSSSTDATMSGPENSLI